MLGAGLHCVLYAILWHLHHGRLSGGGCVPAQVEVMSPSFPSLPILDPVLHPVCSVSPSLYPCLALVCFLDPLPLYLFLVPFSCFRVAVINLLFWNLGLFKNLPKTTDPVLRKMLI